MELTGAGVGTLISRILIAVILIIIVLRHRIFKPYIRLRQKAWHLDGKIWKELLHIGVPTSMQYGMEVAAFAVSGIMIGGLEQHRRLPPDCAKPCIRYFHGSTRFINGRVNQVSNAYGRGERNAMREIGTSTFAGGLIYGLFCGIMFIIFRFKLPVLFTNNEAVSDLTASLLIIAAIFQISDATQAIGVGLLRGIKDVKIPTAFVAIAYWAIGIPVGYFLSFKMNMGASGIWIGFVTGLTASSILLNTRFLKKSKLVV
jgi:MATE family multidrug resistance protein